MNRPEQPAHLIPIPDTQSRTDERHLAIDQVGIRGLRYPITFADGGQAPQPTIATANVYVALPEDRKGTHMSRLVMLLEDRAAPGAAPLTVGSLDALLLDLVARSMPPPGRIELAFPYFVRKTAPVSGVASMLDYEVRLTGELADGRSRRRSSSRCR
jgi:GTP cyclohydrolase I